ncbi:hypothetical protein BY996DRAFT_6552432 [Phakopsora pachyrhizi]|nr:hypothetical protein BY996DRAFT_6552432 [Phakopsora pachyrhizi]
MFKWCLNIDHTKFKRCSIIDHTKFKPGSKISDKVTFDVHTSKSLNFFSGVNTEELAEQEFEKFGSFFKQLPAFRRRELIADFYKMCNGYYGLEPAGVTSVVPNPGGRPAMQFPGATKTSTQRDMSRFEVEDAIAAHKKHWEKHERRKPKTDPLPSAPIDKITKSFKPHSQLTIPYKREKHKNPRSSSSLLDELKSERVQKKKDSPSKPLQEQKDLYQSPYLTDDLIASPSYQTRGKKEEEQDQKSKYGVERTSFRSLYQSPIVKASLSEYAASSSKEDISRLEDLRKEHQKASKLKEEAAERLKVPRGLRKEAKDDLFDLVSRKTSISRRTSVVGSPLPTRVPSISAGSTTDKRKINQTSYEAVTKGSSIKPRIEHEELMRYIPQPLQRFIEKLIILLKMVIVDIHVGISTPELIREHLSAELKKDKKMYEMIEGRNIDEDIRNTQAGKSAGMDGYSYSGYPPFCMSFVNSNHYVVLHIKKVNGFIPAPPIDGWWLKKSSPRNKNVWLQSLENDLKLFQKLIPSSTPRKTRSQNPPNPIPDLPFHTRGSSTRSSSVDGKLKDLYQSLYLKDGLIASPSLQSRYKKADDQDQKSNPIVKDSLSEYSTSSSKQDISMLEDLRKEHRKASKLKEETDERLKVLRSLKNEAKDDLFELVKTSMSRRTSVSGSPLPTRMPSISAGSTTDKRKFCPTSYKTVNQGSSIKPRTEHEELMRYIAQPLQRLIEKIDNPPEDSDCGYTGVAWSSGQGRGISTPELIRKHLSAELEKTKKCVKCLKEDVRNTQAGNFAGVAVWLKMLLFGYAIANHLRRPLYYFPLDSMHTYLPTSSSYSGHPPFCMAFVNYNHYIVFRFKKINGSIPAPPIDGW